MTALRIVSNPRRGWQPFAGLNLCRNPFGELTGEQRVRAAVVDAAPWAAWLFSARRRALQVTGDCGRGKTTHLLAIREQLQTTERVSCAEIVYLPEGGPRPALPRHTDPLLIDEAQRLSWLERRRVFARGVRLVLGTHRDMRRLLRRFGYEVRTIGADSVGGPELIERIMNRRIELARLGVGPLPRLGPTEALELVDRFGSDIRAMEGFLYEQIQRYAGMSHGAVRFVD